MAGSLGTVATSTYTGSSASLIYHHKDHLGGTHVESDSSGASVEYIIYTPFGGTLVDVKAGSYENDHKYTDKEKDEDTGLYYYGARYYNSAAGVFTAQDPVYLGLGTGKLSILNDPQMLNSYSYSRNNPINMYDPDGRSPVPSQAERVFWGIADVATGFIPLVNDIRDFAEAYTGYNIITGEELTQDQRDLTTSLIVVPIISGYIGRNIDDAMGGALSGMGRLAIPGISRSNLPQHAQETLEFLERNGFKNSPNGYKGGGVWQNNKNQLPTDTTYREWDVGPASEGRTAERIVTGENGKMYWTDTHYGDNPGTDFHEIK